MEKDNSLLKEIIYSIGITGRYILEKTGEYLKPALNTALEIIREERKNILLPAMLAIGMGWTGFAYGTGLQITGKIANSGIHLGGKYTEVVGKAGEYEGFGKIPSADIFDVNTNLKRASKMRGIERLVVETKKPLLEILKEPGIQEIFQSEYKIETPQEEKTNQQKKESENLTKVSDKLRDSTRNVQETREDVQVTPDLNYLDPEKTNAEYESGRDYKNISKGDYTPEKSGIKDTKESSPRVPKKETQNKRRKFIKKGKRGK